MASGWYHLSHLPYFFTLSLHFSIAETWWGWCRRWAINKGEEKMAQQIFYFRLKLKHYRFKISDLFRSDKKSSPQSQNYLEDLFEMFESFSKNLYIMVQKSAYSASSPTGFQHTLITIILGIWIFCYFLFWWLKPWGEILFQVLFYKSSFRFPWRSLFMKLAFSLAEVITVLTEGFYDFN